MLRTIYGDPERYEKTYFSELPGHLLHRRRRAQSTQDGYLWVMGRVDDVVNVAGHRLGTAEVESALVPKVAEAAVVGRPDDLKGTALVAFVTAKRDMISPSLKEISDYYQQRIHRLATAARQEGETTDLGTLRSTHARGGLSGVTCVEGAGGGSRLSDRGYIAAMAS